VSSGGEREELLERSAKGDRFLRVPPVANYNWVAIYPDSFKQDVSDLIFWRWLQGYSSGGKSIEEIRDEYGGVKEYIRYLWNSQGKNLEYVLLVGNACDSTRESCVEGDIIPVDVFDGGARRSDGTTYYNSDIKVGDVDGDGFGEVAVGRVPAESCYDVAVYVNKVIEYEQQLPADWNNRVTFFVNAMTKNACSPSMIDSFALDLRDLVPSGYELNYRYVNDSLYINEGLTEDVMQAITIREFNDGRALMLGFGSIGYRKIFVDWLSKLCSTFEIDSLSANKIYPFMVGASCEICDVCHYSGEYRRELIKELLFAPDRGIIAAFGPTGGTWQEGNYWVAKYLLKYIYDFGAKSLGYACMNAQNLVMSKGGYLGSVARSYIYLGDPAIRLKGGVVCDAGDVVKDEKTPGCILGSYPNPFNPVTMIRYRLNRDARVVLSVYDVTGKLIRTLVDDDQLTGDYSVIWDGRDRKGNSVSSGVYFYVLKIGGYRESKKLVLLR